MIDRLILQSLVALIVMWGLIEVYCLRTGQPTISRRIQIAAHAHVQIAVAIGMIVGWLAAHFTGVPG